MRELIKSRLTIAAIEAASSKMMSKVLEEDRESLELIIDTYIGQYVDVNNDDLRKVKRYKRRLQKIKKQKENIGRQIENETPSLWIFEQRLRELDNDIQIENNESKLQYFENQFAESIFAQSVVKESESTNIFGPKLPTEEQLDNVEESLTTFERRLEEFETRLGSPVGWFQEFNERLDEFHLRIDNPDSRSSARILFERGGLRQATNKFIECLNTPEQIIDDSPYSSINYFLKRMPEELESLNEREEGLRKELEKYEEQLEVFKRHLDDYAEELDELHTRINDHETELNEIRSNLESAGEIVDGFGTTPDVFQLRVEKLERDIHSLEKDINSEKVQHGSLENRINSLADRLDKLLELTIINEEINSFSPLLETLKNKLRKLHEQYDDLEKPSKGQQPGFSGETTGQGGPVDALIAGGHESSVYSIKPTNVEFDIKSALEVAGSSAAVSGATATLSKVGIILLLCAAIYEDMRTEVTIEDAFVYWAGYKHRRPRWELPKNELPNIVEEEKSNVDFELSIDERDVSEAVDRLKRKGCLDEIKKDGEPYIIFRETCRVKWE